MTIAGVAVGATQGYIYLRVEYPHACATLKRRSLPRARRATSAAMSAAAAVLRHRAAARRRRLHLRRRDVDAGKHRGQPRRSARPPAAAGASRACSAQPTVVNNVITLATVPVILDDGAAVYRDFGEASPAARCRCNWPATSTRRPRRARIRPDAARTALRVRRRLRERPAHPRRPDRRPAWRLSARLPVRHAAGLRGVRRDRRDARARRSRGLRRHGGHARNGALRDGVLRA